MAIDTKRLHASLWISAYLVGMVGCSSPDSVPIGHSSSDSVTSQNPSVVQDTTGKNDTAVKSDTTPKTGSGHLGHH